MNQTARVKRGSLAVCISILVAVVLTLAGCGGSGGSDAGSAGDPPAPPPEAPAELPASKVFRNFQLANNLFGQPSFVGADPNRGDTPGPSTLSLPRGISASPDGTFFLVDSGNRRVLAYPSWAQTAQFVIGQPDMFHGDLTEGPEAFIEINGVSVGGGKLAVVDRLAHRVLIYSSDPSDTTPPIVVGQGSITAGADQTCDDTHLSFPAAVHIAPDGKLIVSDSGHSRVLIWNTVPSADGQPARAVLGQPGFNTCTDGTSRTSMRQPEGVWSDGTKLAVSDAANHRVLLWDALTMESGQEPARVLGQIDFDSRLITPPMATSLSGPRGVTSNGTYFAVVDAGNNRVLLWTGWPGRNAQGAEVVLGQKDFTLGAENDVDGDGIGEDAPEAQTLRQPWGAVFHRENLIVTDGGNHRVLTFSPD